MVHGSPNWVQVCRLNFAYPMFVQDTYWNIPISSCQSPSLNLSTLSIHQSCFGKFDLDVLHLRRKESLIQ